METEPSHSADEFARALVDAAPDGIVVVDETGRIEFANRQMHDLFGYEREELVGLSVDELLPLRFRGAHQAHRARYHSAPRMRPMGSGTLLLGRHEDGTEFPVEISLSPLRSSTSLQVIAVVRDVSERMEAVGQLRLVERRLGQLEDREQIARDLHDLTIQRLFAAGMSLQGVTLLSDQEDVRARVGSVIDDLDDTIRELRSVIFDLQVGQRGSGLRTEILRVVADASETLGFAPHVRLDGLIDVLDEGIAVELLATLREALSNVARHADASSVDVSVECDEEVLVKVVDDGRGISADDAAGEGIRNMSERALRLGGHCQVAARPGGGTILEWEVPNSHS